MSDRRRSSEGGFTILELLIVVAVIGILAALAIPNFQRAMLRGRIGRTVADAKTLYKGFVQYNVDKNLYPSSTGPGAFDRATLEPLVSGGYLRSGSSILQTLDRRELTEYEAIAVDSPAEQFYAILTLESLPAVQIVVGDTSQLPGFLGMHVEGGYFMLGNELLPLDEDILQRLGR